MSNKYDTWIGDSSGAVNLSSTGVIDIEFPLFDPKRPAGPAAVDEAIYKVKLQHTGPRAVSVKHSAHRLSESLEAASSCLAIPAGATPSQAGA